MRKSVLFLAFVFSLSWIKVEGMDPQELNNALINKSGYSILTVSRDYMENDNTILRKEDFSQVLELIKSSVMCINPCLSCSTNIFVLERR